MTTAKKSVTVPKTVKEPEASTPVKKVVVKKTVKKTAPPKKTMVKKTLVKSKAPKAVETMVRKFIGAAGGVLVIGKFKVRIPRNSLHQAHEFTMAVLGDRIDLTPNNVFFSRRVMVELPCEKPEGMSIICYNDQDGFKPVPIETNYDEVSKVLYGYVTKLDDYKVGKA